MFDCNYVVHESVVSRANQDGTVILMKMDEGNTFFKINGVAAEVWKELSNKRDLNQIANDLVMNYDASEEKIKKDMGNLIDTLLTKNLIKKA